MIHFVIGTRAQLFKMAPVMLECERRKLQWRWVYAAQHRETISETLKAFELPEPHYTVFDWDTEANTVSKFVYWFIKVNLSLFKGKKILGGYTGSEHVVLTHGDTSTTLWGALLGKIFRCKVMHVESGLRSFNLLKPFPEELNRVFTFRMTDYYACPGEWAMKNLEKHKGIKFNTQENTQIDTLRYGYKKSAQAKINLPNEKYAVVSIHRYENVTNKKQFEKIIFLLEEIAEKYKLLFVLHPVTQNQITKYNLRSRIERNPDIELRPRLEYLPFIKAIKNSEFVITDGGGNQEELYHLGKPTLIFRNETERQEGVGENAVLAKFNKNIIDEFVASYENYKREGNIKNIYPSKTIVSKIESYGLGGINESN